MQSRCSKEIKVVKGEITRNVFAKVCWFFFAYLDYKELRSRLSQVQGCDGVIDWSLSVIAIKYLC